MSDLYDTDVVIWSERQADLLGCMAAGEWVNDQIDWANVAEEIAALGISDRRELRNRVRTILAHLLKLQISSAIEQRAGLCDTILEQRAKLRRLLLDSPSLKRTLPNAISEELLEARAPVQASQAHHKGQPRIDSSALSFTDEQVLGPWLPDGSD